MNLIFDVILHIARFDEDAWYKLYRVDERFYEYAKSDAGIKEFILLFTGKKFIFGEIMTTLFNQGHSINDEPAYTTLSGRQDWLYRGKYHRDNDLPALIIPGMTTRWYKNGLLHRDGDMPAVIDDNHTVWYKNGLKHRDGDLPSVISNMEQMWYKNSLIHRDCGLPAIIYADGRQEWWINGSRIR